MKPAHSQERLVGETHSIHDFTAIIGAERLASTCQTARESGGIGVVTGSFWLVRAVGTGLAVCLTLDEYAAFQTGELDLASVLPEADEDAVLIPYGHALTKFQWEPSQEDQSIEAALIIFMSRRYPDGTLDPDKLLFNEQELDAFLGGAQNHEFDRHASVSKQQQTKLVMMRWLDRILHTNKSSA